MDGLHIAKGSGKGCVEVVSETGFGEGVAKQMEWRHMPGEGSIRDRLRSNLSGMLREQ